MSNRKWKLLLAAALLAALMLSACGREKREEGLTIESPTATAAPVADAAPEDAESAAEARNVDPEGKLIALTFDDGPGAGTRRILDALDEVGGRATFCMVGNRLDDYADTARAVAGQGSEIATHTWDHSNLTKLSGARVRRELEDSVSAIERATGVRPRVLRPPYGSVNGTVRDACAELGLVIANWNIDPEDWKTRDAADICGHVLSHAKDGGIVVCHDLYPETASAMEGAIRELSERGYQLVTVSELLEARADGGAAGRVYYAA